MIRSVRRHKNELSMLATTLPSRVKRPKVTKDANRVGKQSQIIEYWGNDNNYPQWVMEQLQDVTLVKPILSWKSEALYGGGLAYGLERFENGKEIIEPLMLPEIDDWLDQTCIDQYLMEATSNFYHFYNIFPAITTSLDGSRINFLHCKESTDARWGLRNNRGYIRRMYLSPDWDQYPAEHKDTLKFPVINPYFHTVDIVRDRYKNKELIYPIAFPSPGRSYYQEAPWHVLLKSWLPIARAIPQYKGSILDNQVSVRAIIRVPEWYWGEMYPDWESKTTKEKEKLVDEEHQRFIDFFHSKDKGKSILVSAKNEAHGTKYASWEIDFLDNKIEKGTYIEDSQEADAHIFKNTAVDPTLFGNTAGKDRSGSGSGSDKRVAWNNYQIVTKPHQNLILKPLQFIARYNGWKQKYEKEGTRLKFYFKNYMIARLDEGSETKPGNQ